MTGIVLTSHGGLAEGILQSAGMVFGPQEDMVAVTLTPDMGPDDLHAKLNKAISSLSNQEEIIFLADLMGGTPFNQCNRILGENPDKKWAIVTGLNLPMLITALGERMGNPDVPAYDMAKAIITPARDGISPVPEELEPAPAVTASASDAPVGDIPEGTVLGDGHIKYVLARIDSRLLHGQVATAWSKSVQPDRIIVVSDAVSKDALRKGLIMKAAPPGIKAHVVPLKKIIEVEKDPRFGATKALLLFENLQDALSVIKAGVSIKKLNLGSMAHSVGKVVVNKVVSMGKEDLATFQELKKMGIEFDVRKVPSDSPENIDDLIAKAESLL